MLVQRDQLAEHPRGERGREDRRGRAVAGEGPRRHERPGRPLGLDLLGGLAERERLGLREEVREEQAVHIAPIVGERIGGVHECDEIGRDQPRALVDQLVEGVLSVGARLTPEDLAGLGGDGRAVPAHALAVRLHRELLQVRREARQLLRVRQHGVRLRTEEVGVPDVQKAHDDGHIRSEGSGCHVLVDRVETREELAEHVGPQLDHERQPDRGVDRIAAADPVPDLERVRRVDAEGLDLVERGRDGDEVVGDGILLLRVGPVDRAGGFEPRPEPVSREASVGQGLERREGLGCHDDESRLGVEVFRLVGEVERVDVGDESGRDARVGIRFEGGGDHRGAEVRPADADVHDGLHGLAGDAGPLARAHPVGERAHRVEHPLHVVVDLLPVDDERGRGPGRAAEGGVQHRAVLGGVDVVAAQHRGEALGDAGLLGQAHERGDDTIVDEVLRQVDVQVGELEAETVDAPRIGGEPAAQIGDERLAQCGELGPGGGGGGIDRRGHALTLARRRRCGQGRHGEGPVGVFGRPALASRCTKGSR